MKFIAALVTLSCSAHAVLQVNPVPFSPDNLYLETNFWDLDFTGADVVKETVSSPWEHGTFNLSLEVRRTGLAICSLTTSWNDGWSSTATFSNSFTWGFIRTLKAPGADGNFSMAPKTVDGLTYVTSGRYNGTLYPYRDEMIADGEFVFRMQRVAADSLVPSVPETSPSMLCLLGVFGAMGVMRSRYAPSKA
jgi:hypothetical protein